ncbi:MAG TPA: N-formylglutamate amidohydrolase [Rhizomicrobium sp.]|jgi:N-formylglutamate deformylase|nr:N-formylglutamate amidohydrolase [Rhizomicrobium sp.]
MKPSDDIDLANLYAAPFRIAWPDDQTVPFVFASPHSGRIYPQSFVDQSRLSALTLRRSEDAFVDGLFASVVASGAPLIAARFPRAYCDVNRSPAELDAAMFDGRLTGAIDTTSPRVNAGLGVIPRIVRDGAEIYREKLAAHEADERLARLYRPYHAALTKLLEMTYARFGVAVLIDCHSMPSAAAVPDVVLGDRYGMAAAPALVRMAERIFGARGFSVARNAPYAGGYTTHLHGRPQRGVHALQIEISRALYLDEERIEPAPRFEAFRARIADAVSELVGIDRTSLGPSGIRELPLAAE